MNFVHIYIIYIYIHQFYQIVVMKEGLKMVIISVTVPENFRYDNIINLESTFSEARISLIRFHLDSIP